MFFLLHRHTDDSVFDDFPKISNHFSKISEDFPQFFQRPDKRFRRLSKTFKEDVEMFRSWTNEFKNNLRDKLDISEIIDIFTSEDMEKTPLKSWMYFCMNFTSGVFCSKTLESM